MKNRITLLILILLFFGGLYTSRAAAQDSSVGERKVLNRVVPQYPPMLRSMRLEGTVRADVLVAPDGSAKSIEVKGGHPMFGQAADTALRQWKWAPAPHETHESITLIFKLP